MTSPDRVRRPRRRIAVVGAGPFGLSIAAHLAGAEVVLLGEQMETWRRMPPGMVLRSSWSETSLSAPHGHGSLDEWLEDTGEPRREPIVLEAFLDYARWFSQRYVRARRTGDAVAVERAGETFAIRSPSDAFEAEAVVLAVGVRPFSHRPEPFRTLPPESVVHASDVRGVHVRGARVLVVGAGQGALEAAAVAIDGGAAHVELVARGKLHWFADREPYTPRGRLGQALYDLAYPVVGYGPPPLNRLVTHPDLFALLPWPVRLRVTRRLLRSGGSPFLREKLAPATLTEGRRVVRASGTGPLRVGIDDGTTREVDLVVLGTGYRFDLEGLSFLTEPLRRSIRTAHGWPVLDRRFESTVPGLFLTGFAAEGRFGPVSRFVLGADFTARRVAQALA